MEQGRRRVGLRNIAYEREKKNSETWMWCPWPTNQARGGSENLKYDINTSICTYNSGKSNLKYEFAWMIIVRKKPVHCKPPCNWQEHNRTAAMKATSVAGVVQVDQQISSRPLYISCSYWIGQNKGVNHRENDSSKFLMATLISLTVPVQSHSPLSQKKNRKYSVRPHELTC